MLTMIPLVVLLGYGGGILINYLADVLPLWRHLASPRCAYCQRQVSFLRYYLYPHRCPECGRIRAQLPRALMIELGTILATIWLWLSPPSRLGFWGGYLVMLFFILVVVIDVEHRLILNVVSFAGLLMGLVAGWLLHGPVPTLAGGLAGFGLMYLLFKFGEVFTRISSRLRGEALEEVALGFGDVNLAGVLGLLLGWPVIVLGLILAILAGGLYSLGYLLLSVVLGRYRSFEAMPYAPYLILAATLLLYFPDLSKVLLAGLSPLMAAAFR